MNIYEQMQQKIARLITLYLKYMPKNENYIDIFDGQRLEWGIDTTDYTLTVDIDGDLFGYQFDFDMTDKDNLEQFATDLNDWIFLQDILE